MQSASSAAILAANDRLAASAGRVARGETDMAGEVTTQLAAARTVEANVAVLKIANELTGTVLDLLA
ncbi:MAG: flagellar hook protein FlgE [Acidobacteriota bacterium]|nr:flagellar hook protein FlgE [Acidobacteriota bacterium]MDQ7088573.1 flagellar hook protein FlgE [Acidobacteriota bacterium]